VKRYQGAVRSKVVRIGPPCVGPFGQPDEIDVEETDQQDRERHGDVGEAHRIELQCCHDEWLAGSNAPDSDRALRNAIARP